MFPEYLKLRYATRSGREALAARLGLSIDPHSQDWEYEVADARCFQDWLAVYQSASLTDDEEFSLMEMLIQCVEEIASREASLPPVEQLSEWQAVAALLRARPHLHASTIYYWSLFDDDDFREEDAFRVTPPMRRLWNELEPRLRNAESTPMGLSD